MNDTNTLMRMLCEMRNAVMDIHAAMQALKAENETLKADNAQLIEQMNQFPDGGKTVVRKPDWKDAPEWANWLAMDEIGAWWWFRVKPLKNHTEWIDRYGLKYAHARVRGWEDTLEPRPEGK